MKCEYYYIGRVPIAVSDYGKTIEYLHNTIMNGGKGYVCVSNMRTVTFANEDRNYFQTMEQSLLNVPDGTPLVWCARWWGLKNAHRVCGPILFEKMLADKEHGFKHFFLGDTDETLIALTKIIEEDDIAFVAGKYSPPFKPLEEYDFEGIARMIKDSGANVVWTSLRAPKQDYLGQTLAPLLNDGTVIVGVGAAFRAYLGELKVTDGGILQKIGLGGLTMVRNDAKFWTELKWYFKHTLVLIGYFCTIKWRKLRGVNPDEV